MAIVLTWFEANAASINGVRTSGCVIKSLPMDSATIFLIGSSAELDYVRYKGIKFLIYGVKHYGLMTIISLTVLRNMYFS